MDFFGEFRFSRLLHFEEAFSKEKVVYEKVKVGGLKSKSLVVLCFWFSMFAFLIQILILQVYNDLVGEVHFHIVGVTNVVSNDVVGGSPIPWVHDSSIVVTFGGPPFDILIGVPYFNYNVIIGFADRENIINQMCWF